jgi:hypothetical protein
MILRIGEGSFRTSCWHGQNLVLSRALRIFTQINDLDAVVAYDPPARRGAAAPGVPDTVGYQELLEAKRSEALGSNRNSIGALAGTSGVVKMVP